MKCRSLQLLSLWIDRDQPFERFLTVDGSYDVQFYRSPRYLEVNELVPLANYHGIEVMADLELTQRDSSEREKGFGGTLSLPIPGSPSIQANSSKGGSVEVTQSRKITDHPSGALNRLVDKLQEGNLLETDASLAHKRQLVELDREWEVSPATDVGNIFSAMIRAFGENSAIFNGTGVPNDFIAKFLQNDEQTGPIVLDSQATTDQPRAIALLSPNAITQQYTVDDLEGEFAVFGQVETYKEDQQKYSLDKFFLSGVNRSARRAFKIENFLESAHKMLGREVTMEDRKSVV